MDNTIKDKTWFTNVQVLYMMAVAISFTFTISMIYSEFILHSEKIETLDSRIDKKTRRNADDIEVLQDKLDDIEKHIQYE